MGRGHCGRIEIDHLSAPIFIPEDCTVEMLRSTMLSDGDWEVRLDLDTPTLLSATSTVARQIKVTFIDAEPKYTHARHTGSSQQQNPGGTVLTVTLKRNAADTPGVAQRPGGNESLEKSRKDRKLIETVQSLAMDGLLTDRERLIFDAMDFSKIGQRVERVGMGYGTISRVASTPAQFWTLPAIEEQRLKAMAEAHGKETE